MIPRAMLSGLPGRNTRHLFEAGMELSSVLPRNEMDDRHCDMECNLMSDAVLLRLHNERKASARDIVGDCNRGSGIDIEEH